MNYRTTVLTPTGFKSTGQVLSRARRGPRQRWVRQYLPRRHRPRDEEIASRRLYAGVRRCHLLRLYQMRDTYARARDGMAGPRNRGRHDAVTCAEEDTAGPAVVSSLSLLGPVTGAHGEMNRTVVTGWVRFPAYEYVKKQEELRGDGI